MARINAYLPGNGVHDYIIITGKYLNLDTIFAQLADSLGRRGLGGIKKRQVTNKYHLVLVGDGKVPCLADKAFCAMASTRIPLRFISSLILFALLLSLSVNSYT